MYSLTVENKAGNTLTLTQNENTYQIQQIEGLAPPQATVNLTNVVGMDGAKFNSAKLEPREIVLYIKINGNAERNRINLYQYFSTKSFVKLYYTNGERNVYIEGIVQSFDCDFFAKGEIAQISILCPYPYFKDIVEIVSDISNVQGLFTFPFSIETPIPFSEYSDGGESTLFNESQSDIGMVIRATFNGNVNSLEIRNVLTGEDFEVDYSFIADDVLIADTNSGNKSVKLIRAGNTTNLFPYVKSGSVFLQLHTGNNTFAFAADAGASDDNVTITLSHRAEYHGV